MSTVRVLITPPPRAHAARRRREHFALDALRERVAERVVAMNREEVEEIRARLLPATGGTTVDKHAKEVPGGGTQLEEALPSKRGDLPVAVYDCENLLPVMGQSADFAGVIGAGIDAGVLAADGDLDSARPYQYRGWGAEESRRREVRSPGEADGAHRRDDGRLVKNPLVCGRDEGSLGEPARLVDEGLAGMRPVASDARTWLTSCSQSASCASRSARSRNVRAKKKLCFAKPTSRSTLPF
ncbi:MAG: hypothetical protein IPJ34_18655 [Myxococcales bacterium]|nr:hypothetical protein [Myxococcales bacterium]